MRVEPKKRLGQHFLVDENILRVIERLAGLDADDVVLEIGPGLGVLTSFLAVRVRLVHAIEIDPSLEDELHRVTQTHENVQLVLADATRLDLASLAPPPTKLVSNLPYSVAATVVVDTLEGMPNVRHWCVMVQREVGERLFARPGDQAYGAVSVLVQLHAEQTGWHAVSRHVFRPVPRVDSALVAFRRTEAPAGYPRVKTVVQAAFAHRRKTLANSLELSGMHSRARAVAALDALGLSAAARAESLSPEQFVRLEELLG